MKWLHLSDLHFNPDIMMMNTELFAGEIVTTGDGEKHENDAGTIILGAIMCFRRFLM